jgi:hypothetical protein
LARDKLWLLQVLLLPLLLLLLLLRLRAANAEAEKRVAHRCVQYLNKLPQHGYVLG